MVREHATRSDCAHWETHIPHVGNIIANQGFINHVGFPKGKGVYTLNANYTALWGAMQSLGQLVGMVLLNPVSDRIGRKKTMYLLWIILAGVSFRPSVVLLHFFPARPA
jgi:MFS family permease